MLCYCGLGLHSLQPFLHALAALIICCLLQACPRIASCFCWYWFTPWLAALWLRLRQLLPAKTLLPSTVCLWLQRPAAHAAALRGPGCLLLLRLQLRGIVDWLALLLLLLLWLVSSIIVIKGELHQRLELHRACRR